MFWFSPMQTADPSPSHAALLLYVLSATLRVGKCSALRLNLSEDPASVSPVSPLVSSQVQILPKKKKKSQCREIISPIACDKTLHLDLYFSAPCQPQGITGYLDCVTNSAWISWNTSAGADSYSVAAESWQGYTGNCSTSSNNTCEVEDLECGVLYSFSVTAENSQCESQPSSSMDLETGALSLLTWNHRPS